MSCVIRDAGGLPVYTSAGVIGRYTCRGRITVEVTTVSPAPQEQYPSVHKRENIIFHYARVIVYK